MTGDVWLDWGLITISLFNTILLLWLGLTVLLNANRRDWGVWLMGGGLLAGACFFISHSAILGQELALNLDGLDFWWRVGWFPVILAPFAWYVAVLWLSGYWAMPVSRVRRRHRGWLWLMSLWLLALMALLLVANPIPPYGQLVRFELGSKLVLHDLPLFFLLFPPWMVGCTLLSLDLLPKRTAPAAVVTDEVAADANTQLARQRARPWLWGTAVTLLVVSLVVSYFIGSVMAPGVMAPGVMANVAANGLPVVQLQTVALYDLVIALLIALAALLLGQAIVSYDLFTGRVLPRRSFVRHWRNAIMLAGGFALLVGWSIVADLRPIYSLLLATLLLTFFYALYSWRSFWEREQFVARLRPFVQSQGIAATAHHTAASASTLLAALCRDVLGTAHAQLIPLGSMAPLVTTTLRYPTDADIPVMRPPRDLNTGMTALDRATYAPYCWAISLWDERGRIGALLIGEQIDGGLYSQEEMETAQATCERIVHLLAREEMMRRLMELQHARTREQRVMDLRTRRTLHDEILPTLHQAVLQLSSAKRQTSGIQKTLTQEVVAQDFVTQGAVIQETLQTLADVHRQIANLLTGAQPAPLRAPDPCELVSALRALAASDFAHSFDEVCWRNCEPGQPVYVDELVGEVVLGAAREIMRNAAAHGRGGQADRPLRLEIALHATVDEPHEIMLIIQDDGVGMDSVHVEESPHSNRRTGNGLSLHSTLLAMIGGYLTIEPTAAGGTKVCIQVPQIT